MVLAARLQHTPAQQQELARDLSEQLLSSGAGADAAVLLLQHLGDVDGAVAALIGAKEWREGLRVAYANGRHDLVDTDLVPAAAQVRGVRVVCFCLHGGCSAGCEVGVGGVSGIATRGLSHADSRASRVLLFSLLWVYVSDCR
jgi:hypothetical protein